MSLTDYKTEELLSAILLKQFKLGREFERKLIAEEMRTVMDALTELQGQRNLIDQPKKDGHNGPNT